MMLLRSTWYCKTRDKSTETVRSAYCDQW